jgi:UDP-2-acetamido-3-amino-2,3-dideoxy-glucuronate N-acetyltransferase
MSALTGVGVVGLGTRGPALVGAFERVAAAEVRWIYDESPGRVRRIAPSVPHARCAARVEELLRDETLDAIAIATPAATRGELARRALEAGKHVLVEAPVTLESADADDLVQLAGRVNRRLVVAGPLCFHPGAVRLKELIASRRLGDMYYLYGSRLDLRQSNDDESVLWGPGAEALSLLLWLVPEEARDVVARGGPCASAEAADVAFCHVRFMSGLEAELRISTLEPRRTLQLTAVGSRGMAVFDELDAERALTVHETDWDEDGTASPGDSLMPRLPAPDPVLALCEHFVETLASPGRHDGDAAAALVAVLDALQRSLERGGSRERVAALPAPAAGVIRLPVRSA